MKKIAFLLLILLCLPLICCGVKPQEHSSETAAPGGPGNGKTRLSTDYDNSRPCGFTNFISTDDAYYYVGSRIGCYIYYYDKASGESDVLCSRPECTHDATDANDDCNGFVSGMIGQLFDYYQGKLYCIGGPMRTTVYRMNPDSTEREELFRLDADESFDYRFTPQRIAIHRGKIYGMNWAQAVVEDGIPTNSWNITSWDLETGEFKPICEERANGAPRMFFYEKYLYFCVSNVEREYPENEDEDPITIGNRIRIYRYDTETEQLEKLFEDISLDYPGSFFAIWVKSEDEVYVAPEFESNVPTKVFRLSDGKLEEAVTVESGEGMVLSDDRIFAFGSVQDADETVIGMHLTVMDYESNVLFDGNITLDVLFGISDMINRKSVGYSGGCITDNAFFIVYSLSDGGLSPSCIVKYELIDGKMQETVIAVSKFG